MGEQGRYYFHFINIWNPILRRHMTCPKSQSWWFIEPDIYVFFFQGQLSIHIYLGVTLQIKEHPSVSLNMINRSLGADKNPCWYTCLTVSHLQDGDFHHLIYSLPHSFPQDLPVSGCQDSAMATKFVDKQQRCSLSCCQFYILWVCQVSPTCQEGLCCGLWLTALMSPPLPGCRWLQSAHCTTSEHLWVNWTMQKEIQQIKDSVTALLIKRHYYHIWVTLNSSAICFCPLQQWVSTGMLWIFKTCNARLFCEGH